MCSEEMRNPKICSEKSCESVNTRALTPHQEINTLIEYCSYDLVVLFSVSPRHQDLRADGKSEPYHENSQIIYARYGRRAQLYLTHTAQKSRIGDADELFHYQAYEDGIGYEPYLTVAVSRLLADGLCCGSHFVSVYLSCN